MRVAYLLSRFPLVTETFIVREFSAVARQGVDVEVMSLFRGDESVVHEDAAEWLPVARRASAAGALRGLAYWSVKSPLTTVRTLGRVLWSHAASSRYRWRTMIATLLALDHARVAQRLGVDHVHAHFATYPATAAMIMARLVGCTFSFTPHAQDIFVDQRGLRLKCREAAFVVAVSRYNRMFLQHFEADPNCLPVIRYGLPASYTYQPASLPAGPRHRVICVSSFREYKGQEYLIRALAARPELVNVEIEFIGDGPLRRGVEALAEQLGVRGRCTFSGKQDQGYVRRQLASAHVLVQPSIVERSGDTEGLPNTLIEAAASGALMVATEVTGIPELVHEGRTGFLALPRDPQSLADALIRATSLSDDEASRIRYAARALVESDYSIDDSALTLISWFRDAARPPRTAAT